MCNGPTYRFSLDIDGTFTTVTPVIGDGVSKVTRKVDGQEFYREEITGELIFLRDDYTLIAGTSIEKKINLNWEKLDSDGNWATYYDGYFTKADCSFEIDECGEGICRVTPDTDDKYDNILSGLDKEFNLIDLAPPTTTLNIVRQPIIQVYLYKADYVNNYLNGTFWEQEVTQATASTSDLENVYHFANIGKKVFIPGTGEGLTPDVSGEYDEVSPGALNYLRTDGKYRLTYRTISPLDAIIKDEASDAVVYEGVLGEGLFADAPAGGFAQDAFAGGTTFTSVVDPTSQVQAIATAIFVRLLTNQDTVDGNPTEDIPASDIVEANANYTKVIGLDAGTFHVSDANNETGSKYGKFDSAALHFAGDYFDVPTLAGDPTIYPVSSSNWLNASYWIEFDATMKARQEDAGDDIVLRDCYKLADALDAILDALDISIRHNETSTYSDFLYGTSNAIRGAVKVPMIAPKSNVVIGEYDQAAKKAPITLADILQLLWAALRCKWHINSQGQFIVEHISYYENGGTYTGTTVGADLTTLIDPQTGKNWGWAANRWTYEKENMPERYEFGWMDDVSVPFEGYPIVVRSEFVQKGKVEKEQVALFTSDIDFILTQPVDISKEGFCFFEASQSGNDYLLPFVDITLPDGTEYKLQNGYAAFVYLHPNYHRYGLPASLITLNEADTTALSITRRKIQELGFPIFTQAEPMNLITTGLGSGKVLEIEENVNGEYTKNRIAHDTA